MSSKGLSEVQFTETLKKYYTWCPKKLHWSTNASPIRGSKQS